MTEMPSTRPTVLVACRQNAGRSQAAAALLRKYAGDRVEVLSGGTQPASEVHPEVRAVLAERGLTPEGTPKRFDAAMVQAADVVVTMGCGEECPYYPGAPTSTGRSTTRTARTCSGCERSSTTLTVGSGTCWSTSASTRTSPAASTLLAVASTLS